LAIAETFTVEKVNVAIQPLQDNAFRLFIKFDLPDLPKTANIDYAVLSLGLDVDEKSDTTITMVFEILSKENAAREKVTAYNANPVTAIIFPKQKGLTQLELDITQLVTLWVKDGEQNEGLVLVSHRNIADKFLTSDKITLAPEFKAPTVKIFYTVLD
jgi:hypothetical protein